MTGPQVLPRSGWSLLLLFVANWIAFANVVSLSGHLLWVIIPSVLAAQAMVIMIRADRRMLAAPVLLLLTVLAAGLSELIGGSTSGPITRSTLMMTTCAGLMVLMWRTSVPSSAALVSLAALAGALGLGAADRIVWSVGMWVVCVCAYLAAVGPLRHSDLADPGRLKSLVAVLLTAGVVASVAGNALYRVLDHPWTIGSVGPQALGGVADTGSSAVTSNRGESGDAGTVRGSASDLSRPGKPPRDAGVRGTPRSVTDSEEGMNTPKEAVTASGSGTANQAMPPRSWIEILGLAALALLGVLILAVALWVAWVQMKWLLLRARLRGGTPAEQVAGAWHWLRLRWAQSSYFDYVNRTPDRIAFLAASQRDPVLEDLARAATEALYARQPELDVKDAAEAWQNARILRARAAGGLPARARASLITPSAASRRESAYAVGSSGRASELRAIR
jgi:hypothetical protein